MGKRVHAYCGTGPTLRQLAEAEKDCMIRKSGASFATYIQKRPFLSQKGLDEIIGHFFYDSSQRDETKDRRLTLVGHGHDFLLFIVPLHSKAANTTA